MAQGWRGDDMGVTPGWHWEVQGWHEDDAGVTLGWRRGNARVARGGSTHLTKRRVSRGRGASRWASPASCSARCSSSFMSSRPLCPGARSDTAGTQCHRGCPCAPTPTLGAQGRCPASPPAPAPGAPCVLPALCTYGCFPGPAGCPQVPLPIPWCPQGWVLPQHPRVLPAPLTAPHPGACGCSPVPWVLPLPLGALHTPDSSMPTPSAPMGAPPDISTLVPMGAPPLPPPWMLSLPTGAPCTPDSPTLTPLAPMGAPLPLTSPHPHAGACGCSPSP